MRITRLAAMAVAAVAPLTVAAAAPLAVGATSPAATPTCFGQPATITGSGVVRGTDGPDVIVAGDQDTEVHAYGGADRICGAIIVYGGAGNDRIVFGRDSGGALLAGGPGHDLIYLLTRDYGELTGGRGNDVLAARGGAQSIIGGPGDDRMTGGRGPDYLYGGPGRDRAGGGYGRDECDAEVEVNCEG